MNKNKYVEETCTVNGKSGFATIRGRFAKIPQGGGAKPKMYFCVSRKEAERIMRMWELGSKDDLGEARVLWEDENGKTEFVGVWYDNRTYRGVVKGKTKTLGCNSIEFDRSEGKTVYFKVK